MPTSETSTRSIRVKVESRYVPERSRPHDNYWFFAYAIVVRNEGALAAQLVSRRWTITDSDGRTQEVRGPGVVGQQPRLDPGESFEYTSFCPLATSFGTMHGTYQMVAENGERFDAEIAPFALGEPFSIN
jgi:ApaG protein